MHTCATTVEYQGQTAACQASEQIHEFGATQLPPSQSFVGFSHQITAVREKLQEAVERCLASVHSTEPSSRRAGVRAHILSGQNVNITYMLWLRSAVVWAVSKGNFHELIP